MTEVSIFRNKTVAWLYTSCISTGITNVNVIYGVVVVKIFLSDGIGKTLCSWWNLLLLLTFWKTIYDIIFMQNWIKLINPSTLLSKLLGMIYFSKTISVMRSRHLFWKMLCFVFWPWRPNDFSSLFLKPFRNFRQSLLWYLRAILLNIRREFQYQMKDYDYLLWIVFWCQKIVRYIFEVGGKVF